MNVGHAVAVGGPCSIALPMLGGDHAARDRIGAQTMSASTRAHHHRVVGVRLVELEHRELGIVRPVDALVPEVVPDLIDAIESADDQAASRYSSSAMRRYNGMSSAL